MHPSRDFCEIIGLVGSYMISQLLKFEEFSQGVLELGGI